jgi:excisionase family DNA binding protein
MTVDEQKQITALLDEADVRIDFTRFVALLREAFDSVGRRPRTADPSSQLAESDIEQLRAGGMDPSVALGAYDRVRARTAAQTVALLTSSLTVAEAAKRLGVSPSRVRQMLAERSLLGVKDGGEWHVLELQFQERRLVPNIGAVARAMPAGLALVGIANWLTTPEPDLEIGDTSVSPLEWLSAGGAADRVAALAAEL